jgi:hypothetical protein
MVSVEVSEGRLVKKYWPNGQLNAEYLITTDSPYNYTYHFRRAYLQDGTQTMEGGNGKLHFFMEESDEHARCIEIHHIIDGLKDGDVKYEKYKSEPSS